VNPETASLILRVSPELLAQVEGASVLDPYGRIITWRAEVADGEITAILSTKDAPLRERLVWALRPSRLP
jgi:hypothetical protein